VGLGGCVFFFFCAAGDLDGSGGSWGEDLRKPPTDASPSAEIEFTLSKKWFSRGSPICHARPGGVWGCAPDPPESELFGNRSVPQRRVKVARGMLRRFSAAVATSREDQRSQDRARKSSWELVLKLSGKAC
jgi:hypothetical protein